MINSVLALPVLFLFSLFCFGFDLVFVVFFVFFFFVGVFCLFVFYFMYVLGFVPEGKVEKGEDIATTKRKKKNIGGTFASFLN